MAGTANLVSPRETGTVFGAENTRTSAKIAQAIKMSEVIAAMENTTRNFSIASPSTLRALGNVPYSPAHAKFGIGFEPPSSLMTKNTPVGTIEQYRYGSRIKLSSKIRMNHLKEMFGGNAEQLRTIDELQKQPLTVTTLDNGALEASKSARLQRNDSVDSEMGGLIRNFSKKTRLYDISSLT